MQAQPNFMLLAVPVHKITWAMGRACIRLTAQLMHMGPPFTTHLKSTQLSLQLNSSYFLQNMWFSWQLCHCKNIQLGCLSCISVTKECYQIIETSLRSFFFGHSS